MQSLNRNIENHYFKAGLFEEILRRLEVQGIDLTKVKRADIAGVDEFHVRGAAVSRELAKSIDLNDATVLDVGCGLGGPCRMLAEEFGCSTTGIDLSAAYVRTAEQLSALVNLSDRTNFVQGDAVELPFPDQSFDVVWTQHVQMNIPDKEKLYAGIKRVLKPGGHFIYYDVFKKGDKPVEYPVPWASTAALSFLMTPNDLHTILTKLDFSLVQCTDQTKAGIDFFEKILTNSQKNGPPPLGINVLMGDSTGQKLQNLLKHLKQGNLELQSSVYRL